MPIHSHFCGEELTELSFFSTEIGSDDCACADVGDTDCCSDIIIKASVKDQSFQAKQGFNVKRIILPGKDYTCFRISNPTESYRKANWKNFVKGSPPLRNLDPSALKVFRI